MILRVDSTAIRNISHYSAHQTVMTGMKAATHGEWLTTLTLSQRIISYRHRRWVIIAHHQSIKILIGVLPTTRELSNDNLTIAKIIAGNRIPVPGDNKNNIQQFFNLNLL